MGRLGGGQVWAWVDGEEVDVGGCEFSGVSERVYWCACV